MKDLNFSKGFVKNGSKNVSEVAPVITLTSTYGNFKLNNKAMAALGVEPGDRVAMFDMGSEVDNQEERYYICKAGFKLDDVEQGALISDTRNFRYSGIYNTMLNGDITVESIAASDLVDKGLLVKQGNLHIALKTVKGTLVAINDGEPVEIPGGEERVLFAIKDFKYEDHTPKQLTSTSKEEKGTDKDDEYDNAE